MNPPATNPSEPGVSSPSSAASGTSSPLDATGRLPSAHTIPVRRLDTLFEDLGGERWIVRDDPIFSHFLATISAVFPNVEDFFVATVRAQRAVVPPDSVLKHQVKGFIGQEAMHGREHRRVNERLAALGYDTDYVSTGLVSLTARLLRLKPTLLPLAVTAAAEHFTVIFAKAMLGDETTRTTLLQHPGIVALGCWHAVEELEHKHVAFDVFKLSGGSHFVRVLGMLVTLTVIGGYVMKCWTRAVFKDRQHLTWACFKQFFYNLRHQLLLSPWALRHTLAYFRRNFHPADMGTDALMAEWSQRLAGQTTVVASGQWPGQEAA